MSSQSRGTFINMLADSQHTCGRVCYLLFMNCHSVSQDITSFSYIVITVYDGAHKHLQKLDSFDANLIPQNANLIPSMQT